MSINSPLKATLIEKESINQLTFPKKDVLTYIKEAEYRKTRIVKAMKLGNNRKLKVKIIFKDAIEIKEVETTIWGVTEKNIMLKQGTIIPIHRIYDIIFF